jgi:hypothetical protein
MTITLSQVVIVVLIGVCIWLATKWLFQKDTEIENRRREAGRLAASLSKLGFRELPEFFIDYSVGDYSGMAWKLGSVAQKLAGGEKAVLAELEDVFRKLLDINLNTPEGRMLVKSRLAEIENRLNPAVEE